MRRDHGSAAVLGIGLISTVSLVMLMMTRVSTQFVREQRATIAAEALAQALVLMQDVSTVVESYDISRYTAERDMATVSVRIVRDGVVGTASATDHRRTLGSNDE